MNTPLVSICCITYNHAPFIRQCLDGFLMQKGVNYEILIHDDCSTDGTTEIVKEYAAKYPDLIFPLYETENQYSKGVWIDGFNCRRAKGKYIAYCEGDDYWTDPLKLQKQVEFMESHPEYSVCFARCNHCLWKENKKIVKDSACDKWLKPNDVGVDISLSMFFKSWITQPLTMMWRTSMYDVNWAKNPKYSSFRDTYMIYHLLRAGKGYLMNSVIGVYNATGYGASSSLTAISSCQFELQSADEIYGANREPNAQQYWRDTVLWSLDTYRKMQRMDLYHALIRTEIIQFPIDCIYILYKEYKRRLKQSLK